MTTPLSRGRIVWVEMADPAGRNPKVRPAVVLTPTADIRSDGHVLVAAVTSTVGAAPRDVTVELPWHRDGHPRTKLRVPSEVVCTWLERVSVTSVQRVQGIVPTDRLIAILTKVGQVTATDQPAGGATAADPVPSPPSPDPHQPGSPPERTA